MKSSDTEHLQNCVSFSSRCRLSVPELPLTAAETAETAIRRCGKERTWFPSSSALSLSSRLTETSLSSAWQHTDFVGDAACSAGCIPRQKSRGSIFPACTELTTNGARILVSQSYTDNWVTLISKCLENVRLSLEVGEISNQYRLCQLALDHFSWL